MQKELITSFEEFINELAYEQFFIVQVVYNVGNKVVLANNIEGHTNVYSMDANMLFNEGFLGNDLVGSILTFRANLMDNEFVNVSDLKVFSECTEKARNPQVLKTLINKNNED